MMTDQFIKSVSESKAQDLLRKQTEIAAQHYSGGTGRLISSLSTTPVMQNGQMRITYPFYIRFLDLSRTATGKRKKGYHPIYNRYVYGFLFIGLYTRLLRGLSGMVRQVIHSNFRE